MRDEDGYGDATCAGNEAAGPGLGQPTVHGGAIVPGRQCQGVAGKRQPELFQVGIKLHQGATEG